VDVTRLLIDTNVYTAFKNNHASVVSIMQRADRILMNATVLGELLSGFKLGAREDRNQAELERFLDAPRVRFVPVDEASAGFYAEVYKGLRQKGRPIPTNDIWIAASAFQHGASVCTLDAHFRTIDGLLVVVP
jgi:predicted nucleic acid-binding protein